MSSKYNRICYSNGIISSEVRGYTVEMPTTCNGALRDLGFVISPRGNSGFVHFDSYGLPYGNYMPKEVAERITRMRNDWIKDGKKGYNDPR